MDGRVKTLHPKIHGALLGRRGIDDVVMREHGIEAIDLVVVNLYPFAATVARPGCTFEEAVENIDIGGPAMVRASAKNHDRVSIVVDPLDYGAVLAGMDRDAGGLSAETRLRLAAKAFAHTAQYDAMVASYLDRATRTQSAGASEFPDLLPLQYRKRLDLRYGENPHQQAAFYVASDVQGASVGSASQVQGKELSFNNLADADTALECVRQFDAPACVIVKHANPCGVAIGETIREAYDQAFRTDPTSAFGGIIAFNRPLDGATAAAIVERQFVEVIIAPDIDPEAREICARKENVRLLVTGGLAPSNSRAEVRSVNGGLLVQTRDLGMVAAGDLKVVTRRLPTGAGDGRHDVRLAGLQVREVECHRVREERRDGRHRRGTDEPGLQHPHRGDESSRRRTRACRFGDGLRRFLPFPRRARRGGGAWHRRRDPAGWLQA